MLGQRRNEVAPQPDRSVQGRACVRRIVPAAPRRILLIVQSLAVGGGDLPCAGPLCLGEELFRLQVRLGVLVVELCQQIRSMPLALRQAASTAPAPTRSPGRGRRGRAARPLTRSELCPERRFLARQRIVALLQRLDL